jgi:hypothetical protein
MTRYETGRFAAVALGILTILYVASRCVFLDRWIMIDEVHWVGRSANFYRALWSGELQYTFQQSHPGVMTMWAGMFAYLFRFPEYVHQVGYNVTWPILDIEGNLRALGVHPGDMLVAGRVSKILMQGAFYLGSLLFVRRLLGIQVAIVTGILIAFDPFLSGLDSMLHVDGLFTIIAFCAVLSVGWASVSGFGSKAPWVVSGAISACAWLTRLQGLIIPLIAGAIIVFAIAAYRRQEKPGEPVSKVLRAGLLWLGGWTVTSLVLFPALWFDPIGTFDGLFTLSSQSVTEPHGVAVYFDGKIYREDPGLLMYPLGIVWHMTPITMLGLVLFGAFAVRAWRRHAVPISAWVTLGTLVAFCVVYFVGMSISAKKLDRYMLPLFPTLELLAAYGYLWAASFAVEYRRSIARYSFPVIASALLIFQGIATIGVFPYRLEYYNPVFGGAVAAKDMFRFGYGEGTDQVRDFVILNARSDDKQVVTASSVVDPLFTWIDKGVDSRFVFGPTFQAGTPQGWYEIDFYAIGYQEAQVGGNSLQDDLLDYTPIKIVTIEGVDYYTVYPLNTYPFPDTRVQQTPCLFDVAPGLRLLQVAPTSTSFDLYLLTTDLTRYGPIEVTLRFSYLDPAGTHRELVFTEAMDPGRVGYLSKLSVPLSRFATPDPESIDAFTMSAVSAIDRQPYMFSKPGDLISQESARVETSCWPES